VVPGTRNLPLDLSVPVSFGHGKKMVSITRGYFFGCRSDHSPVTTFVVSLTLMDSKRTGFDDQQQNTVHPLRLEYARREIARLGKKRKFNSPRGAYAFNPKKHI
jgi:hypothetical protein